MDPFGVPYAEKSGGNGEISFTGQNKDTVWLDYDFLHREFDPNQGRWLSPDHTGLAAVDPASPQSWNRYAYVQNNPLALVDPFGDDGCYDPSGSDIGVAQVNCYSAGGTWLGSGAYVTNGNVYIQSVPNSYDANSGTTTYDYNVYAGSYTSEFGYLFQHTAFAFPTQNSTNDLNTLMPLMEGQEAVESWLTNHILIPATMIGSGLVVAGVGGAATVAVCSTGAGCLLSPITVGVAAAGLGLAGEGVYYGFTQTIWDPTTGKSCGANGCN